MNAQWWRNALRATGLSCLQDTNYNQIEHDLISAFAERWHEETLSFHLLFGEMSVTLDDVSCLLHLPIYDMFLSHEFISRDDAVDLMMRYLGSDPGDALKEVTQTIGVHARFSYLAKIFKQCLLWKLELFNEGSMDDEVQGLRDQALQIYLLYLVGITLFSDKSGTYVDVVYLRYFRDLQGVSGFSWGAACLSHLYKELNHASYLACSQLSGYLSLLQVDVIYLRISKVSIYVSSPQGLVRYLGLFDVNYHFKFDR